MSTSNVFVSYSRADLAFADQLVAALEALEFSTTIDREGIHGAENWEERLRQLILEADAIVFVLTPASAGSEVCSWEVDQAISLNKRILPVLAQPLGSSAPHQHLRDLNYIFFYPEKKMPGSGFGEGLANLKEALLVDVKWTREHTRLGGIASRWETRGQPSDALVRGSELTQWQQWRDTRPLNVPELTDLQRKYLEVSEEAESDRTNQARRQLEDRKRELDELETAQIEKSRRTKYATFALLALLAVLATFIYYANDQAKELSEAVDNHLESTFKLYSGALNRISTAVSAKTWSETGTARYELQLGELATTQSKNARNDKIDQGLKNLREFLAELHESGGERGKISSDQKKRLGSLILSLSSACKLHWRDKNPRFSKLQIQIYNETLRTTAKLQVKLLEIDNHQRKEFNDSVDRFWQLYYGSLALVESNQVEGAMVQIGNILRTSDGSATASSSDNQLSGLIDKLHKIIKRELE